MKPVPYTDQPLDEVILRFTASWCGPCKRFGPIFDAVLEPRPETALIVDIDENMELAKRLRIRSVPTTVRIFVDGEEPAYLRGAVSGLELANWLNHPEEFS